MQLDDATECERRVIGLLSAVHAVGKFPVHDIRRSFVELELARDRLSEILDKAEGK